MNFVRYDPATGEVLSVGRMEERHIDLLVAGGDCLLKVGDHVPPVGVRVDLQTMTVVREVVVDDQREKLKAIAIAELMRTDYTQAADADDHLSPDEQAAWRAYRSKLRKAMKALTREAALGILPSEAPDGNDAFQGFRGATL